ncbi:hypothetical protein PCLA_02r0622 [Pseudomonas citronellolis]|nr:hypothetical protein PCLA_02r0622 [Pseudomonas citronellolis]
MHISHGRDGYTGHPPPLRCNRTNARRSGIPGRADISRAETAPRLRVAAILTENQVFGAQSRSFGCNGRARFS